METNSFFFPATGIFLLLGFFSARVRQCRFTATLPRDEQAALRLLNMTEEKISVIPSEVEESRGNEFFLLPRDRDFFITRLFLREG